MPSSCTRPTTSTWQRATDAGGTTAPFPTGTLPSAQAYLLRGWAVLPVHGVHDGLCTCGRRDCPAPGKHPHVRWERYQTEAPAPADVRRWWRRWPDANVAVVTGKVSGLVVLDVDPRHDGDDELAQLEAGHGHLPPTSEVRTGGGGVHLYFGYPGFPVPSAPIAPGVDVKGDGGLVVAPPSIHVSGRAYAWEAGARPDLLPPADLPTWVLSLQREEPVGRAQSERLVVARSPAEQREFADLWRALGVRLEPGDRYYLCPFHDDHHPSLHVDADGCRWFCFGCGRGGGPGRLRRMVSRGA